MGKGSTRWRQIDEGLERTASVQRNFGEVLTDFRVQTKMKKPSESAVQVSWVLQKTEWKHSWKARPNPKRTSREKKKTATKQQKNTLLCGKFSFIELWQEVEGIGWKFAQCLSCSKKTMNLMVVSDKNLNASCCALGACKLTELTAAVWESFAVFRILSHWSPSMLVSTKEF